MTDIEMLKRIKSIVDQQNDDDPIVAIIKHEIKKIEYDINKGKVLIMLMASQELFSAAMTVKIDVMQAFARKAIDELNEVIKGEENDK